MELQRAEELQGKEGNGVSTLDVSQHNYKFIEIHLFIHSLIDSLTQHYYSVSVTIKGSEATAENDIGAINPCPHKAHSPDKGTEKEGNSRQTIKSVVMSAGRRNGGCGGAT